MTTPSHDGYEVTVTGGAGFRWSGLSHAELDRYGQAARTGRTTTRRLPPTPAAPA